MSDIRIEELMAVLCAREIRDGERIGVGANSPIPAAGAVLAKRLWAPQAREAGADGDGPLVGAKEFTDLVQRGKIDLFYFSAVQIDRHGNMNLQYVTTPDGGRRRFQGAYAAPIYYYTARRTVMFRPEHTPRFLVDTVDYVTASARSPERLRRHGTLTKVITPLAVMQFNPEIELLEILSIHEGHTFAEVQEATGFPLIKADGFGTTEPPSDREISELRFRVYDSMSTLYPKFVAQMRQTEESAR